MRRSGLIVTLVMSLCAPAAWAQNKPDLPPDKPGAPKEEDLARASANDTRPWARGVSAVDQQLAIKMFNEGNDLLRDAAFVMAVDKYTEALKRWNHPAIHYNLVLALVNLDQPIEIYNHLQDAMQYGAAPLDQDKFDRAKGYMLLVEKQLARVDISCDTPGATVFLDGKQLFTAPGAHQGLLRIGDHTVVARKSGFVSATINQKLVSGETMRLNLKLYTDEELTRYRRPFNNVIPWSTVAAGAVVTGVGALLHMSARSDFNEFDQAIRDCGGCRPDTELQDKKSGAEQKQTLAIVSYVVGGAAVTTGLVLLYVNRPRAYRIDPSRDSVAEAKTMILPAVSPEGAGVTAWFRF